MKMRLLLIPVFGLMIACSGGTTDESKSAEKIEQQVQKLEKEMKASEKDITEAQKEIDELLKDI
jgi:septal ring factor EnvC (AmiA/AmiB activator)